VEGASTSWNTWTRTADRNNEDNPSPKKQKKERGALSKKEIPVMIRERKTCLHRSMVGGMPIPTKRKWKRQKKMIRGQKQTKEGNTSKQDKGKSIKDTEMDNEDNKTNSEDSGPYFDDNVTRRTTLHFWRLSKFGNPGYNEDEVE
jgi:hypothetical protein